VILIIARWSEDQTYCANNTAAEYRIVVILRTTRFSLKIGECATKVARFSRWDIKCYPDAVLSAFAGIQTRRAYIVRISLHRSLLEPSKIGSVLFVPRGSSAGKAISRSDLPTAEYRLKSQSYTRYDSESFIFFLVSGDRQPRLDMLRCDSSGTKEGKILSFNMRQLPASASTYAYLTSRPSARKDNFWSL